MATRRRKTIEPVSLELILKAEDDDMPVAVYNSAGKLLGIIAPSKITPVSDSGADDAAAKKLPQPTRATQTEASAGEQPQMGVAKARAAAAAMKKSLYGNATAEDQVRLATDMNAAAAQVLKQIHARGPRRRA